MWKLCWHHLNPTGDIKITAIWILFWLPVALQVQQIWMLAKERTREIKTGTPPFKTQNLSSNFQVSQETHSHEMAKCTFF